MLHAVDHSWESACRRVTVGMNCCRRCTVRDPEIWLLVGKVCIDLLGVCRHAYTWNVDVAIAVNSWNCRSELIALNLGSADGVGGEEIATGLEIKCRRFKSPFSTLFSFLGRGGLSVLLWLSLSLFLCCRRCCSCRCLLIVCRRCQVPTNCTWNPVGIFCHKDWTVGIAGRGKILQLKVGARMYYHADRRKPGVCRCRRICRNWFNEISRSVSGGHLVCLSVAGRNWWEFAQRRYMRLMLAAHPE